MRTLMGQITQYVGIAGDELKRLARLAGTNKVSLLAKYGVAETSALALCKRYNLLSPIYEFTSRGGCFFCHNAGWGYSICTTTILTCGTIYLRCRSCLIKQQSVLIESIALPR